MSTTLDEQINQLKQTIAEMEAQRSVLGDDFVDSTLNTIREKLFNLEAKAEQSSVETRDIPTRQRKLITLLFMDVVGSTAMTQHLDPEDTLEIMDNALHRLAEPVGTHGGHVTRFMGDGFKAIFGDPVAREDDPEQAIRSGLEIQKVARSLAQELQTDWGIKEFQVRIGIDTGLAALGGYTEAEDTVMGRVVNLAVRIESAAPPGDMLISHNTYRHVRGVFTVEPQEPISAKGFPEPVPVYLVKYIKPRAFRVRTLGVEGVETRMVGREAELLTLQNAFRDTMEGQQTQLVTIIGEAGVGKSRLLYEFDNWIELLPTPIVRFFQGRGRQETQNLPYALLKDVFSFRFQLHESDRVDDLREKMESGYGDVLGMGDDGRLRAHIIGQLLGFDFSDSQHLKGVLEDPRQLYERASIYLVEYFKGMSEIAPVVIFLEDIHWADDSSLNIINSLARRIPEQRLLIVCVARQRLFDRRPYWGEGLEYHTQLELRPLTKAKSRRLVREILKKVNQVPEVLQELVVKGAEGNSFYIEELIKMLIEDGVIITGEEQWQVEPDRLAEVEVPDTLTGVLQARLEGLPPDERITLQQASVVGRIFWDDTVEYMNIKSTPSETQPKPGTMDENLFSLRSRELIYHREESAFLDTAEYTFKHAVLRDVTYESVVKRLRKVYHGLVANWLIEHCREGSGEFAGLIADHLELAGKQEQAAIYLYQAGEEAAKRYANAEAVDFYTRALAFTPEDDLVGRYDLLLARENVLNTQGDREAQEVDLATLKEITELLKDLGKQAQVALRRIIYLEETGDFIAILEFAKDAIDLAKAANNRECEANIRLQWGRSLMRLGRNEAAQPVLEHGLELAREYQFHQVEADSLKSLGAVAFGMMNEERFKTYTKQALEKYRQIGDRRGEATALNNLGIYMAEKYDYPSASDYYGQAIKIIREIGNRYMEGLIYGNLSELAFDTYDFNKAIDLVSQSLAIRCEINDQWGEFTACEDLAWYYLCIGEYGKALVYLNRQLEISSQVGLRDQEIISFAMASRDYSVLGDFNQATSYAQRWLSVWHEIEDPIMKAESQINICWFKHHAGDHLTVQDYCRQIADIIGDRKPPYLEWNRFMLLGHASTALGEHIQAEEYYQQAVSLGMEMHRPRHALESQAGLARVSMTSGETEMALTQVNGILAYMDENTPPKGSSHPLDGTGEPFRILLTCYQVLKANNDPRGQTILAEAYTLLRTRAANISDEHLRHCFLNNVAVNREIVSEYENSGLGGLEI